MSFTPSVSDAEEHLQRILKGWRSRYKYIILLKHADKRVVQFTTEWSRRPTPHEPLPSLRVSVEFSFLYDAKMWARAGNAGPPPAVISFRIEHESLVHRGERALQRNIDHHIQRHLHAKSEFSRTHPLPLTADQAEFFASRAAYEPLAHVADSHLGSFAQFAQEARREADGAKPGSAAAADGAAGGAAGGGANQVERELIDMFQRADFDHNGSLDPEEFEELLLNSKWGFTKEDVSVVMRQHDANSDGKLVYSEFIPLAIDLVQAQRASAYAQDITTTMTEAAYRAALTRIQNSKDLHRAMDSGLAALDPADTGLVAGPALVELLRALDLELTDGEVAAVLARIRALNKAAGIGAAGVGGSGSVGASGSSTPHSRAGGPSSGAPIAYKVLQDAYEDVLLESIQRHHLDQEASDVEIFLNALFKKIDVDNTGILDEKAVTSVLSSNPGGISLSSTQIYAIIGDHKPLDGAFKYRTFARKAALMIYQLLDAESLHERNSMLQRSAITPIQLLGTAARARVQHAMRSKLREFDSDGDGQLSPSEFAACMADTGLLLSASEVAQLLQKADTDGDGMVSQAEFTTFAYETLLHLQRDATLKDRVKLAIKQKQAQEAEATARPAAQ